MRAARLARERSGVPLRAQPRWVTHDDPYTVERPPDPPRITNALVYALTATPDRELVAGVLVTVSVAIENDGDRTVDRVHLTLVTSPALECRDGGLTVDGRIEDDDAAQALVAEGITIGSLAPRQRTTYVMRFIVTSGAGDMFVVPYLRAHRAPILGSPMVRLGRRAGSSFRDELARERDDDLPFFELDPEEELIYEAADAALSSAGSAPSALLDAAADGGAIAPVEPGPPNAPVADTLSHMTLAELLLVDPLADSRRAGAADEPARVDVAVPHGAIAPQAPTPTPTPPAAAPAPAPDPEPAEDVAPPTVSATVPNPALAESLPPSGQPQHPLVQAAEEPATLAIDPRWHQIVVPQVLRRTESPPASEPAALAQPVIPHASAEPPPENVRALEVLAEFNRESADPARRNGAIVGLGGPILRVGIDRARLTRFEGLFGPNRSLGTIAHYLLWLGLAAVEPADGDEPGPLAEFAHLQERKLLRALVEAKLRRPVSPSVAALVPAALPRSKNVFGPIERERIARPAEITLFRAYRARELDTRLRTANAQVPAFGEVAELFGSWSATGIALAESIERRAAERALEEYRTAMSIENNRLMAHVRAGRSPDVFVSADAALDDRARRLLTLLRPLLR